MSALSQLLTQANVNDASLDDITASMHDLGHKIGRDTVWKYLSGRHTVVRRKYLEAFVAVWPSLKLTDLEEAAQLPPDLGPWTPPEQAHTLNQKERAALDTIIISMSLAKAPAAIESEGDLEQDRLAALAAQLDEAERVTEITHMYAVSRRSPRGTNAMNMGAKILQEQRPIVAGIVRVARKDEQLSELLFRGRRLLERIEETTKAVVDALAQDAELEQTLASQRGKIQPPAELGHQGTAGEDNQDQDSR